MKMGIWHRTTIGICIYFLTLSACEAQIGSVDPSPEQMVSMINTGVDPAFEYEYELTKFVPPEGKTLLIMGQTLQDIDDYMTHFSDQPLPGGWSAYWGIPSFEGITTTHSNDNGASHNHQQLVNRFPNTVIQSGMWMVGTWDVAEKTALGHYDEVIRQYSAWAKSVDRPIYLRIGYEFDGPHNELNPVEYVRAYQRVVDIMRREGVENVAYVWHSYLFEPYNGNALSDYYPGDEYVDWVGISTFGILFQGPDLGFYGDKVMEFARAHKKPVMIAEASPTSGINETNTRVWDTWFVNFFTMSYRKNIKAISMINANWFQYDFPGTNWQDARLSNNESVADAWFLETNKDRYLKESPELFKQLGYK